MDAEVASLRQRAQRLQQEDDDEWETTPTSRGRSSRASAAPRPYSSGRSKSSVRKDGKIKQASGRATSSRSTRISETLDAAEAGDTEVPSEEEGSPYLLADDFE
eukprot:5708152-Karenia_brevis.AAC.1